MGFWRGGAWAAASAWLVRGHGVDARKRGFAVWCAMAGSAGPGIGAWGFGAAVRGLLRVRGWFGVMGLMRENVASRFGARWRARPGRELVHGVLARRCVGCCECVAGSGSWG